MLGLTEPVRLRHPGALSPGVSRVTLHTITIRREHIIMLRRILHSLGRLYDALSYDADSIAARRRRDF